MISKRRNTLVIMSDEHSRKIVGAYGNEHVVTPNLDALASRGTLFESAYCNSPICVPSRASLHTGLYPHQIRKWDNAMPYDGKPKGWGHSLQEANVPVVSIGKLHFRDSASDTGFDEQILPLHVKDGIGDPTTLLRHDPPPRPGTKQLSAMAGKGETPYWEYDFNVASEAERWLASRGQDNGWTLFVSFVLPHFPLNAPKKFRELYNSQSLPFPKKNNSYNAENETVGAMRALLDFQDYFGNDGEIREAVANYYALCSALDENIGRVLAALERIGATQNTTVIYTSDHGDNIGARGYWGKSTLWEESAGVPMIIAGPDVPQGKRNRTPVSLVDLYPTIVDLANAKRENDRPGANLVDLAQANSPDRPVFSEYHAVGSKTGMSMLRLGHFKLIECVNDLPLLYDLENDPEEIVNLALDPAYAKQLEHCRSTLSSIVNPKKANKQAFKDQASLIEFLGGEDSVREVVPLAFTHPGTSNRG